MINFFTAFSLIKPTIVFTFNVKRLVYLLSIPVVISVFLMILEKYYPLFSLALTADLRLQVNYYTLATITIISLFLVFSLMLRTQQIVFFGKQYENKRFFIPLIDKPFLSYILKFTYIFLFSLTLSAVLGSVFILILNHFVPIPDKKALYILGATLFLLPYFFIRLIFALPAKVAGKDLRLSQAWRMTRKIGPMIAILFAVALSFPLLGVTFLFNLCQNLLGEHAVFAIMMNAGALSSFLFSCIFHSAYCSYMYLTIVQQN